MQVHKATSLCPQRSSGRRNKKMKTQLSHTHHSSFFSHFKKLFATRRIHPAAGTVALMLTFTASVMPSMLAPDLNAAEGPVALITSESSRSLESKVFELANRHRMHQGLSPLTWNENAAETARSHSADMANSSYLSHTDRSGKRVGDRAKRFGLNDWKVIGENVAWLTGRVDPADHVINQWMASSGHRGNILQHEYRETGVGLVIAANGKYYFTQVFVLRR